MAWTDNIPAVGNKISVSVPAIEANFAWLKALLNNDLKDWTGTGIGKSAYYYPDPAEADQGVTATGTSNTVYDLVTTIGSTKKALIYFRHAAADADTTTYQFKTDLNIPENITVYCEPGAIIKTNYGICDGGGTYDWTVHSGSIYKLDNTIVRPTKLYESGTEVTEVADVASIVMAGQWAWYGNTVYIWTTGSVDPDTLATDTLLALVTVEIQHTQEILVDWFGAIPDGDAGTSSGLPILAAILAAANGSIVQFFGDYYNEGKTLTLGSSKFLTVQGPATIYYGGTGRLFEIKGGTGADKIKHSLKDLNLYASTGNERSAATQIAIYLEGTTFCRFENISIENFYVSTAQHNTATLWSEMNQWIHVKGRGAVYGVYLDTAGNKSMGTCVWDHCSFSVEANGTGFYLGPTVSLYRARFHIVIFNRGDNAIAYSINGSMREASGQMHVEGAGPSSATYADNVGFYFGATSKNCTVNINSNIIGCNGGAYTRHADATIPSGFTHYNTGRTAIVWNGKATRHSAVMEAGYLTLEAIEGMSRANPMVVTLTAHGLASGDEVTFTGIKQAEWIDLNNDSYEITWVSADTFSIDYDSSAFLVAYDAGTDPGKIRKGIYRQIHQVSSTSTNDSYYSGKVKFIDRTTNLGAEFHAWLMAEAATGTANDTTPSVAGINVYRTDNTLATTITKFDDGVANQILWVYFNDNLTTLQHGAASTGEMRLEGAQDYKATRYDVVGLWYNGVTDKWTQIGGSTIKEKAATFANLPTRANTGDMCICTNEAGGVAKPVWWQGTKWILATGADAAGP